MKLEAKMNKDIALSTAAIENFRGKLMKLSGAEFMSVVKDAGLVYSTVNKFRVHAVSELGAGKHERLIAAYEKLMTRKASAKASIKA